MIPWGPEVNPYISFILYAILGKMAEADNLMKQHQRAIYTAAVKLQNFNPPNLRKIYRGLLIEPENMGQPGNIISRNPDVEFVSFSEDKDVACWFADTESLISFVAKMQRPDVEGWMIEYTPKMDEILFYWKWGLEFPFAGKIIDFNFFAQRHPDPAIHTNDYRVTLRQQKEYIIKPLDVDFAAIEHADAGCPPTIELDSKFWSDYDQPPGIVFIPMG